MTISTPRKVAIGAPITNSGEVANVTSYIRGVVPHSDDSEDGYVQLEMGANDIFAAGSIWVRTRGAIKEGDDAYYDYGDSDMYTTSGHVKVGKFETSYDGLNIVRLDF